MKTLAISNQKGGVGKTTIAVHVALQARSMGYKVLFIDADIQANSSMFLKEYIADNEEKLNSVGILPTAKLFVENADLSELHDKELGLLCADTELADMLSDDEVEASVWKENLESLNEYYDLCVIDTPPTLSLIQVASIIVADYVLSPIELNAYSVQGVIHFTTTLNDIKTNYNPDLKFLGLLPSRVNKTNNNQLNILDELHKHYKQHMFDGGFYIPERQALSETSSLCVPIWEIKQRAAQKVTNNVRPYFEYIVKTVMETKKEG